MAKKETTVVTPEKPVVEIDYSKLSMENVLEAIGEAYAKRNMKLMGALSKLYTKKETEAEKAKKEALQQELVTITRAVRLLFTALVEAMSNEEADKAPLIEAIEALTGNELAGAEGIWFAFDFGEVRADGTNPSCRLVKSGRKAGEKGESTGKSSYVANPAKSADLLTQVGENVMFDKDTEVTIDKQGQVMPAGMTFKEAYDFSTNGGWRNRVRMALLKEAGII